MALDFDGNYVEVPDSDDLDFGTGKFTIIVRINSDDVEEGGRQHHTIMCKQNPETPTEWILQILAAPNRTLNFRSGASNLLMSSTTLSNNTDCCVIVTRDATTIYLYLNDSLEDSVADSTNLTNAANLRIGYRNAGYSGQFDGRIWDACICKGVSLSLTQVKIIQYAQGADNIVDGLVGRWLMNEKPDGETATVASSVIDISGQGNHGTPTDSPVYRAAPVRLVRPLVSTRIKTL